MPVTLDDDLTILLIKHLVSTKAPAGTGATILSIVQENQKLLLALTQKADSIMSRDADVQTEIAGMKTDVEAQTTVANSVLVYVTSMSKQLADAIAKAEAAGATAEELAALKAVHATMVSNTAAFTAAITANTTATTEPAAPVVPTTTVPTPTPVAADPTSATGTTTTGTTTGDDTGTATVQP